MSIAPIRSVGDGAETILSSTPTNFLQRNRCCCVTKAIAPASFRGTRTCQAMAMCATRFTARSPAGRPASPIGMLLQQFLAFYEDEILRIIEVAWTTTADASRSYAAHA